MILIQILGKWLWRRLWPRKENEKLIVANRWLGKRKQNIRKQIQRTIVMQEIVKWRQKNRWRYNVLVVNLICSPTKYLVQFYPCGFCFCIIQQQGKETAITVYGKRVDHLKSVIKSCGMRFSIKLSRSLKKLYVCSSYSWFLLLLLFFSWQYSSCHIQESQAGSWRETWGYFNRRTWADTRQRRAVFRSFRER